ncbi:hypothetical protein DM450_25415 (plasmid) [Sphingomonas sp. IC081]|nr:hypothetical protein DM450_25415 [Sphingomonas sp. IC081]
MKYLILIGPFILIFHFLAYPIASNMIDYDLLGRSNVLGFKPYGGFFGHKNLAGIAFGVLAVCAFDDQALLAFGKFRKVWVGLYFVALLATGAAGPLIATIMALILAWGLKLIVRRSQFSFFFLLGSSFTAALAALVGANGLLSLVGRTSGMTGRDMLFEAWRIYFWQRPMLGYGYANFFTGLPDSPGAQLMWLTPWHKVFLTFESSYLEAAIQFGIFGCILLFIIYIMGFYKALKGAMTDPTDSVPRTMVALLVLILVSSISDTYLTLQNSIFPTLVAASFYAVYARPAPRRTRRNEPIPGGGAARA